MPVTKAAAMSLCLIGASHVALAQEGDASIVATVNGKDITTIEMGFVADELGPRLSNMSEEQKKGALTQVLVDLQLVAQAAEAQGLDRSDLFSRQMDFLRQRALRNEYFRVNVDEAITAEELKAAYDAQIGALPSREQVKARHILVESEEEAKALITELDGGADFVELAKAKSTGPSGPNGGDLGYFGQGQMVPAFEAAAFALDVDAYTKEPVQTQFGWHIVLVEDKREEPKPSFEQVEQDLRSFLAQQKFSSLLNELKEKASITIAE